jgi:hypothetical protein
VTRTTALILLVGANVAAEVVSFSSIIDRVPPLRWLDRLGQRPERRNGPESRGEGEQPDQGEQSERA